VASLQDDPAGIERFFGVFTGAVAPQALFGPPSGTLAA
jgi:hypothetical protein